MTKAKTTEKNMNTCENNNIFSFRLLLSFLAEYFHGYNISMYQLECLMLFCIGTSTPQSVTPIHNGNRTERAGT